MYLPVYVVCDMFGVLYLTGKSALVKSKLRLRKQGFEEMSRVCAVVDKIANTFRTYTCKNKRLYGNMTLTV